LVSVSDTLRIVFTPVMCCARTLGGPKVLCAGEDSMINIIAASTPPIAALLLMSVLGPLGHRIVVTCFSRCQSQSSRLVSTLGNWVFGSLSL
jgi:hypothetical protein